MYVFVSIKRLTIPVVYTDLSGKELHTQVAVCIVVTSESLGGEMLAHWPRIPEMWVQVPL